MGPKPCAVTQSFGLKGGRFEFFSTLALADLAASEGS